MSPTNQITSPEYHAGVRIAVREGIKTFATGETAVGLVRAVVDKVLALPAPPAEDFPLIYGLPDAPAIAWMDWDHQDHIAIRSGHPGNGGWTYNGKNVSSADLLAIIGDHRVAPMDFRINRQKAPSEYRK